MVEPICVDPARVKEFWPHVKEHIRSAIEATNLSQFEDTERQVLSGEQLLWLGWSNGIEVVATTHKANNVCTIVSCAGQNRKHWLSLREHIENYAKAEGCRCVRIYGRPGWQRVLTDYKLEHVVLEKDLR